MIGNALAARGNIGAGLAVGGGGAAVFVGPFDNIPNIVAAFGPRRGRSAYTGYQYLLRRASDDDEEAFGTDSNGDLLTAAIASWAGGANAYCKTMYDWSGNAYDATQTDKTRQPLYVASGQNGRPVLRFDGVDDRLRTANFSLAQPDTVISAFKKQSSSFGNYRVVYDGTVSLHNLAYRITTGVVHINAGSGVDGVAALGTTARIASVVYSGASSTVRINGASDSSPSIGTNSLTGLTLGGAFGLGSGQFCDVDIFELVICNAALSDANRQAAEAAANAYWSVF